MKKFASVALALALLAGNSGYAANSTRSSMGSGAQAGTYDSNTFAWGLGLGALVIVGVVVGVAVAGATGNPNSGQSH
ncbi:MAG: hypothetical protein COT85_03765 [Chlamydiae bacterium CG10_big_fil_rev_8_21_14_0_10_42_34]|nr:MAG: hypothetical protein COT85_03765 [Chlamydiae bacterium CG10_big_fil_rev_8_21_14_0_10_42_34]